jgi:Peptidase family M20/M25/M40
VDDKFIYGIGVSNMKAGDSAYFCALRTLIEAGVKLKGDVILTFVVGELQGGVGTLAFIRQGLRADYFENSEPTDLAALTMRAAVFTFVFELYGVTRHMSKREEGVAPGCLRGRLRPGASVTNTGLTGVPGLFARNQDPLGAVWRIKTTAKWWLQGRSEITRKLGLAARLSTFGARPSIGAWRLPKAFVPFPRPLIT